MNYYISRTASQSGKFVGPETGLDGFLLPDNLIPAFVETMGFAIITEENGVVTSVEINQPAYDAYIAEHPLDPPPTASQKRRQAYTTGEVDGTDWRIDYEGERKTCDELTLLGMQYYFRNETDAASAIRLLVEAKILEIRTAYPDEVGE